MHALRPIVAALLLFALPALGQEQTQQAPGLPGGDAGVQSTAPEVGAGRGGFNEPPPPNAEPGTPTGTPPPPGATQRVAPQPAEPAALIAPGPPMGARDPLGASELELQRTLRGGVIEGRVSIPNQSAGILIQPQGRDWRQLRNEVLTVTGLVLVVGAILALGAFYALRGRTKIESGRAGRRIQRYTLFERANHWMVAASFVLLALTGLNITYGIYVLRPLIGPSAFAALTLWGQWAHHYIAFAFMLGVLVMLVMWARENLPRRVDVEWVRTGGPLSKSHPPAGKFNAGQKLLYWFVMLGGIAMSGTGIMLMWPGLLNDVVSQQWAHIAHGLLAMAMIAVILGHIYIGSLGMEGAFEGMYEGQVDYNWAREHHRNWLEQELTQARRMVANEPMPTQRVAGGD